MIYIVSLWLNDSTTNIPQYQLLVIRICIENIMYIINLRKEILSLLDEPHLSLHLRKDLPHHPIAQAHHRLPIDLLS